MPKRMVQKSLRLTKYDLEKLKELVKMGYFRSVNEAIRYAIDRLLRYYDDVT